MPLSQEDGVGPRMFSPKKQDDARPCPATAAPLPSAERASDDLRIRSRRHNISRLLPRCPFNSLIARTAAARWHRPSSLSILTTTTTLFPLFRQRSFFVVRGRGAAAERNAISITIFRRRPTVPPSVRPSVVRSFCKPTFAAADGRTDGCRDHRSC